jgi:hypothetical protein
MNQFVRERRYVATLADENVQSSRIESAAGWAGSGLLKDFAIAVELIFPDRNASLNSVTIF